VPTVTRPLAATGRVIPFGQVTAVLPGLTANSSMVNL